MDKAGSGPRREGWRRIRAVLLAPPFVLIVGLTLLFVIGVFATVSAWSHAVGIHTDGELMAFFLGFLIAGFLGTIWYFVVTLSGGADWLTGARAERWTAKELSKLGSDWHQFSNVPLPRVVSATPAGKSMSTTWWWGHMEFSSLKPNTARHPLTSVRLA